jgi:hypothetical protein
MRYVSLKEACLIARKTPPTIRRWALSGRVRTLRTPLGWLYDAADIRKAAGINVGSDIEPADAGRDAGAAP